MQNQEFNTVPNFVPHDMINEIINVYPNHDIWDIDDISSPPKPVKCLIVDIEGDRCKCQASDNEEIFYLSIAEAYTLFIGGYSKIS